MSAIKDYYHDEICGMEPDPQADYPNPDEEKWWMDQDEAFQRNLEDRENRSQFEIECEVTLPLFERIWADQNYRMINAWLLGAGSFCSKKAHDDVIFLSNISFYKEDL